VLKQGLTDAVRTSFFMPSPALAPYVSTYYLTEFALRPDEVVEDWLHPEWANVRMSDTAAWKSGPSGQDLQPLARMIATGPTGAATHFSVSGAARTWGIGLLPCGWLRFANAQASQLADKTEDVSGGAALGHFAPLYPQVFSGPPDPPREAALIDAFMLDLLSQRPPHEDDAKVRAAHAALVDDSVMSVADLADRLGMSSRSLERLSLRAFGFSPKLLLRRQRFLRSLAQFMLDPSLTWIKTLDWHYVDQAHFVRDFRRFMAMSPSEYAAVDHPVLRSAARARAVAAGAAVQALHRP
jgi:AraC-like DNA-binding protein